MTRTLFIAASAALSFFVLGHATMAKADTDAGAKVFKRCAACHTAEAGGKHRAGPALWNIHGRAIGSAPDFKYSSAMASKGGTWDDASLDAFLTKPKAFIPGTRMSFPGLSKAKDRVALIAFLRTRNDAAPATPNAGKSPSPDTSTASGASSTKPAAAVQAASSDDFEGFPPGKGAEETMIMCTACHSSKLVMEQGQTRKGWSELMDWMIAKQAMPKPDTATREIVLDYLAEHFNTDRGRSAKSNIAKPSDEFGGFPAGDGAEEAMILCTPCHSAKLVMQQGLTRKGWNETIDWMISEQEMETPEPADRAKVLDYLAKYFNTDRPNYPGKN